jgi:ribosomal protein RSM22 (predicted rRNA methylase)
LNFSGMNWDTIDWKALERLRAAFLAGTAGGSDYWQGESDLASYDATFAQRIGWKWDYVLAELQRRDWSPAPGALLDWGCGSGIAHRAFLDHFGAAAVSELRLWDRSPLAVRFAGRRAREKYPGLKLAAGIGAPISDPACFKSQLQHAGAETGAPQDQTLLISHVLTELQPAQVEALADFAASFASVLWVEPGTFEASLTLIAVRKRLRAKFNIIAPCTHQAQCGILAPGNEQHWCHHFASPPPEVFTDGNWTKFGELAGVDLRSLPLSFLVLDRRPAPALPTGVVRVIGRPRLHKPHALLLGCDESGVTEKQLTKRRSPEIFRQLKRGDCDPLQLWRCEGGEIVEARPL